eukprot:g4903.t1
MLFFLFGVVTIFLVDASKLRHSSSIDATEMVNTSIMLEQMSKLESEDAPSVPAKTQNKKKSQSCDGSVKSCSGHGYCQGGSCFCWGHYKGKDCSQGQCPKDCNSDKGWGKCVDDKCVCSDGRAGTSCDTAVCPSNNCNGHGVCVGNKCHCQAGFAGSACETLLCPNLCFGHGTCLNGKCKCDKDFAGAQCQSPACKNNCSNNGYCETGDNGVARCICFDRFSGDDCSETSCPTAVVGADCSGNGLCVFGVCKCDKSHGGKDCSQAICDAGCVHGECVDGKCECEEGFRGVACDVAMCPDSCSNNGYCHGGVCYCKPSYSGKNCAYKECPSSNPASTCSGHGKCIGGSCSCTSPWSGLDCSYQACPQDCNENGLCRAGKCHCFPEFSGEHCEYERCPENCNGHGTCAQGTCFCIDGWSGKACVSPSCAKNCSGHGKCVGPDECSCDEGFSGKACENSTCPGGCGDHGFCYAGTCQCANGWAGTKCDTRLCPYTHLGECSGHGTCHHSDDPNEQPVCKCDPLFGGPDCSRHVCPGQPKECSGHGQCTFKKSGGKAVADPDAPQVQCSCDAGWFGTACKSIDCKTCDDNGKNCNVCNGHGKCSCIGDSCQCKCNTGYGGSHCEIHPTCTNDCSGHGRCKSDLTCECFEGFSGDSCDHKPCPGNCGGETHGFCMEGICYCNPGSGYTGPDCNTKVCPRGCSGNGYCVEGKCVCKPTWTGKDCSVSKCPGGTNVCSGQGICAAAQSVVSPAASDKSHAPVKSKSMKTEVPVDEGKTGKRNASSMAKQTEPLKGAETKDASVKNDSTETNAGNVNENGLMLAEDGFSILPIGGDPNLTARATWSRASANGMRMKVIPAKSGLSDDTVAKMDAKKILASGKTLMKCFCFNGFAGEDCSKKACSPGCKEPSSVCDEDSGVCYCRDSYTGTECSKPDVAKGCRISCGENGTCVSGECKCDDGWGGKYCTEKVCPSSCEENGHGKCHVQNGKSTGLCVCDKGWHGESCEKKSCASECHYQEGQGVCKNGHCYCKDGFAGDDCGTPMTKCPKGCSGHGACHTSDDGTMKCQCKDGYLGSDCSAQLCKGYSKSLDTGDIQQCSGHGVCDMDQTLCMCDAGFHGEDCSCTRKCLNGGKCMSGECVCRDGFMGAVCEKTTCDGDCLGRGRCEKGKCVCRPGYEGAKCETLKCPNVCSNKGLCSNGVCRCSAGFINEDCSVPYDVKSPHVMKKVAGVLKTDYRSLVDTQSKLRSWLAPHRDTSLLLLETYVEELKGEYRERLRRMREGVMLISTTVESLPANHPLKDDVAAVKKLCHNVLVLLAAARQGAPKVPQISHNPGNKDSEQIDVGQGEWAQVQPVAKLSEGTFFQRQPADIFTLKRKSHEKLTKAVNKLIEKCGITPWMECPNECSAHGKCSCPDAQNGDKSNAVCSCTCDKLWTGVDCQSQLCVNNCSGHGTCGEEQIGICKCDKGWSGDSCSARSEGKCTKNCMAKCHLQTGIHTTDASEEHEASYWKCYAKCIKAQNCLLRTEEGQFLK